MTAAIGSRACLTRHGCRGGQAAGWWWRPSPGEARSTPRASGRCPSPVRRHPGRVVTVPPTAGSMVRHAVARSTSPGPARWPATVQAREEDW